MNIDVNVFKKAKSLVKRGWCQHSYAQDETGVMVLQPTSDRACKWCMSGAILAAMDYHLSSQPLSPDVKEYLYFIADANGIDVIDGVAGVFDWNDEGRRTKEQVLAALDLTIEHWENVYDS